MESVSVQGVWSVGPVSAAGGAGLRSGRRTGLRAVAETSCVFFRLLPLLTEQREDYFHWPQSPDSAYLC